MEKLNKLVQECVVVAVNAVPLLARL